MKLHNCIYLSISNSVPILSLFILMHIKKKTKILIIITNKTKFKFLNSSVII